MKFLTKFWSPESGLRGVIMAAAVYAVANPEALAAVLAPEYVQLAGGVAAGIASLSGGDNNETPAA